MKQSVKALVFFSVPTYFLHTAPLHREFQAFFAKRYVQTTSTSFRRSLDTLNPFLPPHKLSLLLKKLSLRPLVQSLPTEKFSLHSLILSLPTEKFSLRSLVLSLVMMKLWLVTLKLSLLTVKQR